MNLFESLEELSLIAKLVYTENLEALEQEIAKGFELDSEIQLTKDLTDTIINFAIYENKKKVVTWLISKGAKFNYNDTDSSLFLMACRDFDFEIVKLLLDNGAKIGLKDDKGFTAMKHAELSRATETIEILKAYKA